MSSKYALFRRLHGADEALNRTKQTLEVVQQLLDEERKELYRTREVLMRNKQRHRSHSVEICCFAPEASQVSVAGTFNNWVPESTHMSKSADGTWRVKLTLPPGFYEYKFVMDGRWVCEPGADEDDPKLFGSPDYVRNPYGTMNRKLKV